MRQVKKKYKLKNKVIKPKRRIKNRIFPVLLSLLIVSVTYGTTQAYFNSKISFADLLNGNDDSGKLNITNGNVNLEFSNNDTAWRTTSSQGITSDGKGTYICSELKEGNKFEYGPVKLTSVSNLTTNVDLSLDFDLNAVQSKEIPIPDDGYTPIVNTSSLVPGFEVIVGDMDNFGFGFEYNANTGRNAQTDWNNAVAKGSRIYDVYTQYTTLFNRAFDGSASWPKSTDFSRPSHGMRVFPNIKYDNYGQMQSSGNYDATGTDRRMVNSGFYDWVTSKNAKDFSGLKSLSNSDLGYIKSSGNVGAYEKSTAEYSNLSTYYWAYVSGNNAKIWYDGYTDRAMKGIYGVWQESWGSNWVGTEIDHKVKSRIEGVEEEKNWKYLQKVEPLTFKYAKIPQTGKISSLCIQVYVDDIQPGKTSDELRNFNNSISDNNAKIKQTSFSWVSQNKYIVSIKGTSGDNWIEVPEWSNKVNALSQSGPSGQMITFNLGDIKNTDIYNQVISALKSGSGLDENGLQLKIDDAIPIRDTKYREPQASNEDSLWKSGESVVSGDSYAIDFAKMTVNGNIDATETTKTLSGQVIDDNNNPLEGVTVITSNAFKSLTSSNGSFTLKPIEEDIKVTFIKSGYQTKEISLKKGDTWTGLSVKMEKIVVNINPDKVTLTVQVKEYLENDNATEDKKLRTTVSNIKDGTDADKNQVTTIQKGDVTIEQYPTRRVAEENCLLTETKYKNINILELAATQAQCTITVNPGSRYEVYYILDMDSVSGYYSYQFTSSIKAKSTQENNSGWTVVGTGNKYSSSIKTIGDEFVYNPTGGSDEDSGNNQGSGSTPSIGSGDDSEDGIDAILKNNTPGVYFQNAKGWSGVPQMLIKNKSNATTYGFQSGNEIYSSTSGLAEKWYTWNIDENNLPEGSQITVKDGGNNNNTSGNLYYFNTKKIFICTN